jgi:hypothetical protein
VKGVAAKGHAISVLTVGDQALQLATGVGSDIRIWERIRHDSTPYFRLDPLHYVLFTCS